MNYKGKSLIYRILCGIGSPSWFMREIHARHKVTIINYHNPSVEVFERHIQFLNKYYSFISIDEVLACIKYRNFSQLPPKPLLVTFDDGYRNIVNLIPIIQQYKIPAVVYCVAGVTDTNRHFWFDKLPHQSPMMHMLKQMKDIERRKLLRLKYNHWDEKEYDEPMALSRNQLNLLIESGCTIGAHSLFHPILTKCDDETGILECQLAKHRLEKLIDRPVQHFAFPNGNFDNRVLSWVRKAGYISCRTTNLGWVTINTHPLLLPCIGVSDNGDPYKALLQASGFWSVVKRILNIKKSINSITRNE